MVTRELDNSAISEVIQKQRAFFNSNKTLDLKFRLDQLKKLYETIDRHEKDICDAIHKDFKKPFFEAYGTEVALVKDEIKYFLKRLPQLMRPEKVKSSLVIMPAKSYIYHEPYGLSLIISPWNYPFQLTFLPLVGALATGNCVVLKPSELTVHTSGLTRDILAEIFDEDYVSVLEGGPDLTTSLLKEKFDHIFFTGSVPVGKIIYEAAAKQLTPCVLELGGKSPCIVDNDANLELASRRIVWGKFLNGGQTCIAPDYLLVHRNIKDKLLDKMVQYIHQFYGEDPAASPDFPRIINQKNFNRLVSLLEKGTILTGGKTDPSQNYIDPTIVDSIEWEDPVMQEEIFGPILPVIEFSELEEVLSNIRQRPKPLAFYYFSGNKKKQEKLLSEMPFGGGCINDTLLQFGSPTIPVGGVGESGIGRYHGKSSFLTFSNSKSVVKKKTNIDIPFRYAPYEGRIKLLKLIFKL
jgi:aldehyde dehydrogenase (NAD+)